MEWLYRVREKSRGRLRLRWRAFLLEQVNAGRGPEWKAWEDPSFSSRDIPPLEAAKCAALQGEEAFDVFNRLCYSARHQHGEDVSQTGLLMDLAAEAGLDLERFRADFESGCQRAAVVRDHEDAVKNWGVFGVPTLVYPSGEAIYLKLGPGDWEAKPDDGLFDRLMELFATRPYLLEVKKPESTGFVKMR